MPDVGVSENMREDLRSPASQKLRDAKGLSLAVAVLVGLPLAAFDIGWIISGPGHDEGCDCGGAAVALWLIGLYLFIVLIVSFMAVVVWVRFLADSRRSSLSEPLTGWWTRIVILDAALIAFIAALVTGPVAFAEVAVVEALVLWLLRKLLVRGPAASGPNPGQI